MRPVVALVLLASCHQVPADSCQHVPEVRLGPVADPKSLAREAARTFSGVVVDSASHRGLPGATVVVYLKLTIRRCVPALTVTI